MSWLSEGKECGCLGLRKKGGNNQWIVKSMTGIFTGTVLRLNNSMIGIVIDAFNKRIWDVGGTAREHTTCAVVADRQVLDIEPVLVATSSL